jgi:hypothetical protein
MPAGGRESRPLMADGFAHHRLALTVGGVGNDAASNRAKPVIGKAVIAE